MKCPSWLKGDAKDFFNRHQAALEKDGILTPLTLDGFCLLAECYRLTRECKPQTDSKQAIQFIGLLKQFQTLSKQYGLLPRDRKASGMERQQTLEEHLKEGME